jgi:hypothetical protein
MQDKTQDFIKEIDALIDLLVVAPLQERDGKWYFREVDVAGETTDSFQFLRKVK